jgi:hypothetical protein
MEFTAEDMAYRVEALREVWQQDRALQGNLTITVTRVVLTGDNPAAGLAGTKTDAAGFPRTLPVYFRNYSLQEIAESHGRVTEQDREMVLFDTSDIHGHTEYRALSTDVITSGGERWHIKSIYRNAATKIQKITVSPVPLEQATQR